MFTNREIAISFWLLVLFVYVLINKGTRDAFVKVLKVLASRIFVIVFSLMTIYISGIVYVLYRVSFWDFTLAKGTLIWITFTACALLLNSNDKALEEDFFTKKIIQCFKFTIVIEFIVNTYTFSLFSEIVLTFILVFLGALQAFSGAKEEYKQVEKLTTALINILGIIILSNAVYMVIINYKSFGSISTLKSFLLPIILTILYLPFVYVLALYTVYEHINIRLKMKTYISTALRRYVMYKIFTSLKFKLSALRKFQIRNMLNLTKLKSKEDIKQILSDFKATDM